MSMLSKQELGSERHTVAARRYSRAINFINEIAEDEPHQTSTSVDIFSNDGNKWYCQVRRGDRQTQPLGPYTKLQAERIQEARRQLIAKRGTARLVFETGRDGLRIACPGGGG
jgi:hypothetical protein